MKRLLVYTLLALVGLSGAPGLAFELDANDDGYIDDERISPNLARTAQVNALDRARGKAWNILEEYDQGDVATDPATGKIYISKINGNVGNTFASTESWQEIESGAGTMTGAEIAVAYEAEPDRNAYTDADQAAVAALGTAATLDADTTGWATGKLLKFDASGNLVVGDDNEGSGTLPTGTEGYMLYYTTGAWTAQEPDVFDVDGVTLTKTLTDGVYYFSVPAIDASGFDGNLATTDDTLQEVAQKVDDLSLGSGTAPTIQTNDPTDSDATGWYLATTSGDLFYVNSGVGMFTVTGTYAAAAADTTPPTITGVTGDGTTIAITYDEAVSQGSGYNDNLLNLDITDGNVTSDIALTYASGDGTTTHNYTAATAIASGDTVNLDWLGGTDALEDAAGNDLDGPVTDQAVTNSTPVAGACSETPFYVEEDEDFTNWNAGKYLGDVLSGAIYTNVSSTAIVCAASFKIGAIVGDVSSKTYQIEIYKGGDGSTTVGSLAATSQTIAGSSLSVGDWAYAVFDSPVDLDQNDLIVITTSTHANDSSNYLQLSYDFSVTTDLQQVSAFQSDLTINTLVSDNATLLRLYGE